MCHGFSWTVLFSVIPLSSSLYSCDCYFLCPLAGHHFLFYSEGLFLCALSHFTRPVFDFFPSLIFLPRPDQCHLCLFNLPCLYECMYSPLCQFNMLSRVPSFQFSWCFCHFGISLDDSWLAWEDILCLAFCIIISIFLSHLMSREWLKTTEKFYGKHCLICKPQGLYVLTFRYLLSALMYALMITSQDQSGAYTHHVCFLKEYIISDFMIELLFVL